MPSQSLPDGVKTYATCPVDEERVVRLSDLPKIEEQVRQQELEKLADLPTRFQDREELAANNGMLGVAQGWLDARRLLVKSLTGEDKMLVAAFDVEAEGRKRRLSELDQARKQVRQQVREELRRRLARPRGLLEGALSQVQQAAAKRDINRGGLEEVLAEVVAAIDQEADRG